jgi:hypothetical protein
MAHLCVPLLEAAWGLPTGKSGDCNTETKVIDRPDLWLQWTLKSSLMVLVGKTDRDRMCAF